MRPSTLEHPFRRPCRRWMSGRGVCTLFDEQPHLRKQQHLGVLRLLHLDDSNGLPFWQTDGGLLPRQ